MSSQKKARSQLFTLRVWPETGADGTTEWRARVQRVADGETLYFRNWDDLQRFVFAGLTDPASSPDPDEPAPPQ